MLDPRFKLEYFKKVGWLTAKINNIREKATDLWNNLCRPIQTIPDNSQNLDVPNNNIDTNVIIRMLWNFDGQGSCSKMVIWIIFKLKYSLIKIFEF